MNLLISSALIFLAIDVSRGISINSVLRLSCKGCVPKPNQCCIGTAVSPNYILTTSYCGQVCQSIERGKEVLLIKEIVIYPNPKTFVVGNSFNGPNTVALIKLETKENSYSYVDSTAENVPLEGLKALIPILDDTPMFKTVLTKNCDKNFDYLDGYYICATDENADCDVPHGTPLFSNDQLLGIAGMQDFTCQYSQIRFIAITPLRYWIQYQLKDKLISKQDKQSFSDVSILRARSIDNAKENYLENETTKPNAVTSHKSTRNTIKKNVKNKPVLRPGKPVLENMSKTLELKKMLKELTDAIMKKPKGDCDCSSATQGRMKKTKVRERNAQNITIKHPNPTNKILQTNIIREYMNDKIKSNGQIRNFKISSSTTKTQAVQSTSATATNSKSSQSNKITNAMDWFIQMRKTIIKTDNASVLIVSTTRVPLGEFVDLT